MKPVARDPRLVPVQLAKLVGEEGVEEEQEAVDCPARECMVSLDDCLECHASDGLVEQGGQRFVRCRRLTVT